MPVARPDVQAVLDAMRANPAPPIEQGDPATARQTLRQLVGAFDTPSREMPREDVTVPSSGGARIQARVYRPVESASAAPVLVYCHGGGFVTGDLESYDPLCSEIAFQLGITVVSVDYRLAPEHPFPAAVEDCFAAMRWCAGSPEQIGHPVDGLIIAGDSSGGTLAAVGARELYDMLAVPILAQWLIYPATDQAGREGYPSIAEFGEGYLLTRAAGMWFMWHYLGRDPVNRSHPHASPYLAEEWEKLPPALVFTCELDPLRDQGRAYAAKLISHGVPTIYLEAKGQIHGCFGLRQAVPSTQGDLTGAINALKMLIKREGA